MCFALYPLKNGIAFRISSDDPCTWTGYAHALKLKKNPSGKQTRNKKTHEKTLQIGLFWEKMLQRWNREAFFQQEKDKTSQSPPLRACFLELDWLLLALISGLLCGYFRDTVLWPWGLMTSVSSLDFCRAEHDGLSWSWGRNVELYCSHLSPSSPLTPAPELPPPFPFNSSDKIPPTEQK